MNKAFVLFFYLLIGVKGIGQDALYPLQTNAMLDQPLKKKILSTRADDSTNYLVTIDPIRLPFYDDFSADKRLPRNIDAFVSASYYQAGLCPEWKGYKMKNIQLSFKQTYIDTFNPSNPPFYRDSVPTVSLGLTYVNDTPLCTTLIFPAPLYPATCRYKFNSAGDKIDSVCSFDTTISAAYIKEATFKDILWLDHYAYFNDHYGFKALSKGVATLDGLNENGRPYSNPIIFDDYGRADYLTSSFMDISNFSPSDSMYLSFYYQPQGYGDWPDKKDSLIVEMRDSSGKWNQVFSVKGFTTPLKVDSLIFKAVTIQVPPQLFLSDPVYYFDSFQFRFSNFATLTGNNDHWHIDYVKLDTARTYDDTVITDYTFTSNLPSILKNYTLIPAKHFKGNSDLKDTIIACNRNIIPNNPILNQYSIQCDDVSTGTNYFQTTGLPYTTSFLNQFILEPSVQLGIPSSLSDNSVILTKIFVDASGDDFRMNDTASHYQVFGKEMAYDDGSAEMAYGLQGLGLKKVAYKFLLPLQDTLSAIKIMFSNIDVDVSSLVFNIDIWKSIVVDSSKTELLLKSISNQKAHYIDTLNQFFVFPLDTQLIVEDSIYVGWTQSDEKNLQIGYDCNSTLGRQHTYIFTNNTWTRSNVITPGSPMIRLLLDGNYKSSASAREALKDDKEIIDLFPNPASEYVNLQLNSPRRSIVRIFNLLGRELYHDEIRQDSKIDLMNFDSGIYIVTIERDGVRLGSKKLNVIR